MSSAYSSTILSRSRPVSRCSRMSRIAWAWTFGQAEVLHEAALRAWPDPARRADQLDHLVEVVEGDDQTLEDVGPFPGAGEIELGAPDDDLLAVVDEVLQQLLEVEDLRLVVEHPEQNDAEGGLHLGELVEVVEHHLGDGVALELDDHPDAIAVGLVAEIGDALEALGLDQVGDLLDQPRLVDLVGQLVDDDRRPLALLGFLDAARARIWMMPRPVV